MGWRWGCLGRVMGWVVQWVVYGLLRRREVRWLRVWAGGWLKGCGEGAVDSCFFSSFAKRGIGKERCGKRRGGLRCQILYVSCPVEQRSVLDSLGDAMGEERVLCSFPVYAIYGTT